MLKIEQRNIFSNELTLVGYADGWKTFQTLKGIFVDKLYALGLS